MRISHQATCFALAVLALSGCANIEPKEPSQLSVDATKHADALAATPRQIAPPDRVTESQAVHIPVVARKVSEYAWLRAKKIKIAGSSEPVPMSEILKSLSKQGVSITSELPLDRFMYSGFSLDTDAETALRAIVMSVGLDYVVDDYRKLVSITPLASKTWYLNIGNRKTGFSSGVSTVMGGSKAGLGSDAGLAGTAGGTISGGGSNVTAVSSLDDFWGSLRVELDSRLQLMLPDPVVRAAKTVTVPSSMSLPPLVPPGPAGTSVPGAGTTALGPTIVMQAQLPNDSSDGILKLTKRTVGTFSVNPETGAVAVQAPHWVLEDLNLYLKRVQEMYNTDIMFQGELVLLTTTDAKTEGLDISSFAKFAQNNYGIAYQNNGLGGVTMAMDSFGIAAASASSATISGPTLGLVAASDGLAIFNAYLSNLGDVSLLQRPMLTTTSGVPADFRRVVTKYFNTVSQQASTGSVGAATVATTNTLVAQDFGTVLRVNPRIDMSTGLIRAQIELVQTTQTGIQVIPQAVSAGSSVSALNTSVPTISKVLYSGEALLKNGDMIVMGGQTEDTDTNSRSGITGLMDVKGLNGIFGKDSTAKEHNVFYFALKVSVTKR
jgi:hypothetical protein